MLTAYIVIPVSELDRPNAILVNRERKLIFGKRSYVYGTQLFIYG
jgi:hypothetical protein